MATVGGRPQQLRAAADSRMAPHHEQNEDAWSIYAMPSGSSALVVVCDGVSSAGGGAPAARLACQRVGQFFDKGTRRHPDTLAQLVSEIDWELRGAGRQARCTLAMAWVDGTDAWVFTVGDSPIYRLRQGRLRQAGMEGTGTFRRLQAFLGMGPAVSEVLKQERWELLPGDVLLLLSDGVLAALEEEELAELWARSREPQRFARSVIEEVARHGVDDDATVLVVELYEEAGGASPERHIDAPDPPRRLLVGGVD
jgi:serine/threonine protein phosphatase PrpC